MATPQTLDGLPHISVTLINRRASVPLLSISVNVENLIVRYESKVAVNGLSFNIKAGEIYGLLGPNGAGKTSTIKAMTGLVERSGGSITILGETEPSSKLMNKVGVVLETPSLLDVLTPNEFLNFVASVREMDDVQRVKGLVSALDLEQFLNVPIASLSMGNKQKVAVVAALMHKPLFLILDEPFNGLDVKSVRIFKDLLARHAEEGGSVLFSTHIMEVAEKICNRIGIINDGKMVAEGTVSELREKVQAASLEDVFLKAINAEDEIKSIVNSL